MRTLAHKTPQTASAKSAAPHRAHVEQRRAASTIQQLQRRIGKQALQRMLQGVSNAKENAAASERTHTHPDFSEAPYVAVRRWGFSRS